MDELGVKFRSTRRQMANVVRRYENVVMVCAEEKGCEHREDEYPKADCGVASPHERGSY